MIVPEQRQMAIQLIDEARIAGARLAPACQEIGITERTFRRWKTATHDRRVDRINPEIAVRRRLSKQEKLRIINTCNEARFASIPPSQIVPMLADEDTYIASESSFYRVLKEFALNARRGRTQTRHKPAKPKELRVNGPGRGYS